MIPRYVNQQREEEEVDVAAVQREIEGLEADLARTLAEMTKYLRELGLHTGSEVKP